MIHVCGLMQIIIKQHRFLENSTRVFNKSQIQQIANMDEYLAAVTTAAIILHIKK